MRSKRIGLSVSLTVLKIGRPLGSRTRVCGFVVLCLFLYTNSLLVRRNGIEPFLLVCRTSAYYQFANSVWWTKQALPLPPPHCKCGALLNELLAQNESPL